MNGNKKLALVSVNAALLGLILLYGNCSQTLDSTHSGSSTFIGSASSIFASFNPCDPTKDGGESNKVEDLFAVTYRPFLKSNCASCHVENSDTAARDVPFASNDLTTAFGVFEQIGYKKIETYATTNHKTPYTGSQHRSTMDQLSEFWEKGILEIAQCRGEEIVQFVDDEYADVRVVSDTIPINPVVGGVSTVRWNLDDQIYSIPDGVDFPDMQGAIFQISVKTAIQGGEAHYQLYDPRLMFPTTDRDQTDGFRIKSIKFQLNGRNLPNETTFQFVDVTARKNLDTLLSAGAMVGLTRVRDSDFITVSFGEITYVTGLPPAPEVPEVNFADASITNSDEKGQVNVRVRLNQPVNDQYVTVRYRLIEEATTAQDKCCSSVSPYDSDDEVDVDNFDRDFETPIQEIEGQEPVAQLTFNPGDTEVVIPIDVIEDDRYEGGPGAEDELVVLELVGMDVGTEPGIIGDQNRFTLRIGADRANDPQVPLGAVTFSSLMRPGGAFNKYCLQCHHLGSNGQDTGKEYDMTNYQDLVSDNRVVPGDLDGSAVWGYIQGFYLGVSVPTMPKDGVFNSQDPDAKADIRTWILNGAKNN